ncbi:MAG: HAMP domain-containing histidine kinase, partial [Candidatus Lokiarchaeota archaeon]|nr:HAMP domain-containing histidine kinase [Candidatus Lokiarchaeota archaeon]
ELRTPLSALKAHIDLLRIKINLGRLEIPEEVNEKIETVARNADRLAILINNLLDYARLEAGTVQLDLKLGSLDTVAVKKIKELLPLAKKHGQILNLTTPKELPYIYMDTEIIQAIINNLISNAIKYTPDGGQISIKILEEDENLHIIVTDTGIGIKEEDLETIFQPFYVADIPNSDFFQNKSEFERTGLGLAIIKEYVKMHHSQIWAESRIGEGSSFHVLLPKKKG